MTSLWIHLRPARPITALDAGAPAANATAPRLTRRVAVDRRQAAATVLVGTAQALLACGYALLVALLWSAAIAAAP
jgi:hypothetical protein